MTYAHTRQYQDLFSKVETTRYCHIFLIRTPNLILNTPLDSVEKLGLQISICHAKMQYFMQQLALHTGQNHFKISELITDNSVSIRRSNRSL